jgi:Rho-binding antiterminator
MTKPYQVINCDFHDVLEIAAMQRQLVVLVYLDDVGRQWSIKALITDVFARAGADYLRLASNELIRLDQIIAVDGLRVDSFPKEA